MPMFAWQSLRRVTIGVLTFGTVAIGVGFSTNEEDGEAAPLLARHAVVDEQLLPFDLLRISKTSGPPGSRSNFSLHQAPSRPPQSEQTVSCPKELAQEPVWRDAVQAKLDHRKQSAGKPLARPEKNVSEKVRMRASTFMRQQGEIVEAIEDLPEEEREASYAELKEQYLLKLGAR